MSRFLKLIITAFWACVASVVAAARPAKPNIVLFLTDDLGWQDVKCYDIDKPSPMETPNIDQLATQGVMFRQAYSPAPVCSPSRVAILSGLHPVRNELTSVAGGTPPHFWRPNAGTTSPWNGAHMPAGTVTLADALKAEGYVTGHSGKWHFSPAPWYNGFDTSCGVRGVQTGMPNRLTGFATDKANDPYRLDENGYPYDDPQHAALDFMAQNREKPFFLYYATWLVHAPIQMRSEQLLRKYEKKLGVEIKPEHRNTWRQDGQTNPFYCAMVEQLDYYAGQVFSYLKSTDDPRWPGHKLSENTYVIFTSDNGGMEGTPEHRYTDNEPLDRGKISTKEGGTRVPLIIVGPDIPAGVKSDVMVNGLDFYPTILSLVGASKPEGKTLDGCDLATLLTTDPTDPTLVRDAAGNVRDTMFWHFPQMENSSSIRVGDYKFRRLYRGASQSLELYRLFRTENGKQVRADIEEQHNLATEMPDKLRELDARLKGLVAGMGGREPHLNPDWPGDLPGKEQAPTVLGHQQTGDRVEVTYRNNGAKVVLADLFYTLTGGSRQELWHRATMTLDGDNKVVADLPAGATHYIVNLIDENNFLAVYPKIDAPKLKEAGKPFSAAAIFAGYPQPEPGAPVDLGALFARQSAAGENVSVLLSQGFEDGIPEPLHSTGDGVSCTTARASVGTQCLQLQEVAGLDQVWKPLVGADLTIPAAMQSGTFRIIADVMLDPEAPGVLSVMLRDSQVPRKRFASAGDTVIGNGVIKTEGMDVMALPPGVWCHLDIAGRFGAEPTKMLTVSATTADGGWRVMDVPYQDTSFERLTSVNLAGVGPEGSSVYVDNLVITAEAP